MAASAELLNEQLTQAIDVIGHIAGTDRAATVAALGELPQSAIASIGALVRARAESMRDRQLSAIGDEITALRQQLEPTITTSGGTYTCGQLEAMGNRLPP